MPTNQILRPRYFEGQFLGAADLTAAIDYARLEDARHNLGGHTWGIAAGLEIKEQDSPAGGGQVDVFVQPGYAWDGFGRPIVVLSPFKISAERFASFAFDATKPNGYAVSVWLRYQETATQGARAGFEVCQTADQNSRIDESFQLEVGPRPTHPDQHDQVSVGGRSADAQQILKAFDPNAPVLFDESVSYQAFPEAGDRSRWLVPLGDVMWKPDQDPNVPGTFAKIGTGADFKLSQSRRIYIGVVAGSIEAPGAVGIDSKTIISGHIRLHDRSKEYSKVLSDDLVWVEGSLRIQEGDLRLFDGKVVFRDKLDQGIPLQFRRAVDGGGTSIQTVIGTESAGNNTFAVGPIDNTEKLQAKLVVRDDGKVGIGTTTPSAALHISGAGDQSLDISSTDVAHPSYTRLMAVTSNGLTESQLQFNNMFYLVAPLGGQKLLTVLDSGNAGIGTTAPLNTLHVARGSHLNVIFDRTDTTDHLTAVVGGSGSGLRFSDSNFFFIGKQPYAERNSNDSGTELFHIDPNGDVGILSSNNPLRFTSAWSDFPAGNTNRAEISNDTTNFRTLMIVGNRSNNGVTRRVSVWDTLEVNGLMQVIGDTRLITPRLQLGAKWLLSAVGDAHGNDDWLRLFDINNTGYYGGFAAGRLWSSNGTVEGSDAKLKDDIAPLNNALEGLLSLQGVRFKWRSDQKQRIGLIAQDVEKVFPELVETGPDGFKGIYTSGLFGPVIEAMKEQHEEITRLRLAVKRLSGE